MWWPRLGALRFVDMYAGVICTLDRHGRVTRKATGSSIAAFLRPRAEGGAVVATERGLAVASRDDLADLQPWGALFADARQRFNDGGCSPAGHLYAGTRGYRDDEGIAMLYRIDSGEATGRPVLTGLTASNGLGWSPDGSTFYLTDSGPAVTYAFDYSPDQSIRNQRVFVKTPLESGRPDGLTVDAEGGVWLALKGTGRLVRYDDTGRLTQVIQLPGVTRVTSCTFGGPDLKTLFITVSREKVPDDEQPAAGAIWAVEPGVAGLPVLPFRGELPRHYA